MAGALISESLCSELRKRVDAGERATDLAQEHDISRGAVRYHIYGECNHEVEPESLTSSGKVIPESECRDIRSRYAFGKDVDAIAEDFGHTWKTTVRHLSGECRHGGGDLAVEKRDILEQTPVTEQDCVSLRRSYVEKGEPELLVFARNTPWTYHTVLRHLNGRCDHDVETSPRATQKRTQVTEERCREFRQRYRENSELTLSNIEPLVQDYEASAATIRRHIRFQCPHDPESTLLDDVGGWEELLDNDPLGEEPDEDGGGEFAGDEGFPEEELVKEDPGPVETNPDSVVELAAESGVTMPDEDEAAADLPEPDTDHVKMTTARVVRNTEQAKQLKDRYQYHCQLCGDARHAGLLEHYAETHHLKPLGRPHEGPDDPSNVLVLCPNHHSDFDHGLIHVDPETLEVTHATDEEVSGRELLVRDGHELDPEMLSYHNEKISKL